MISLKKNLELRYLEARKIRGMLESDELKKRYYKLLIGYEGENEVYIWLGEFGSWEWLIFYDLWFEMGNGTQADIIVVADTTWFLFEVKNYDGHFRYENGESWLNNLRFKDNVMSRMDQRVRKLQYIADELHMGIKVEGAMIFINEHCSVEIDQGFNFDIVMRNNLKQYLRDMKRAHPNRLGHKYLESVNNAIGKYRGESPFKPTPIGVEAFGELRKGIPCVACGDFNTVSRHKTVLCTKCGSSENKSAAIIRSAKQLRLLYFDQPEMVTRKNVYEFMGNMISATTVKKTLSQHFQMKGSGSNHSYYIEL